MVLIAGANHFFQGTRESPNAKLDRMQAEMYTWLDANFAITNEIKS